MFIQLLCKETNYYIWQTAMSKSWNAFFAILHTALVFMLIYCGHKSTTKKLITLQIPHCIITYYFPCTLLVIHHIKNMEDVDLNDIYLGFIWMNILYNEPFLGKNLTFYFVIHVRGYIWSTNFKFAQEYLLWTHTPAHLTDIISPLCVHFTMYFVQRQYQNWIKSLLFNSYVFDIHFLSC